MFVGKLLLTSFCQCLCATARFVISQYAKVGDLVAKGQSLYEIDISRNTTTGNVSTAQIEVINEKIANAEDIITKLSHNKEEFAYL
jgi:membrane fusion protein